MATMTTTKTAISSSRSPSCTGRRRHRSSSVAYKLPDVTSDNGLSRRSPSAAAKTEPILIYKPGGGLLTEGEIQASPMDEIHKELALCHLDRLSKVIYEENPNAIPKYTTKFAAREQLAYMTLVIRDYLSRKEKGKVAEISESMITDVIDASYMRDFYEGTWIEPIMTRPLILGCKTQAEEQASALYRGRRQEIATILQNDEAGHPDDVIELWNTAHRPEVRDKILPDHDDRRDIGHGIDWSRIVRRSKSSDNLTYHAKDVRRNFIIPDDKEIVKRRLESKNSLNFKRCDSRTKMHWPPALESEVVSPRSRRSRADTGTSRALTSWVEFMQENVDSLTEWTRNCVHEAPQKVINAFAD